MVLTYYSLFLFVCFHSRVVHSAIPGLDEEDIRDGIRKPKPYYMLEELRVGNRIGDIIRDARLSERFNESTLSQLTFNILRQEKKDSHDVDLFEINEDKRGILQTKTRIDRDELCHKEDRCLVEVDVGINPEEFFLRIQLIVEILDINDNEPRFPEPEILRQVTESQELASLITIPKAVDDDIGRNSIRNYELVSSSDKFSLIDDDDDDVDDDELRISVKPGLDRETVNFYQFKVIAYDGDDQPKSGSVLVNIEVLDTNDNHPTFDNTSYRIYVLETVRAGTPIGRVSARDRDIGPNGRISYSLSESSERLYGDQFRVDNLTGTLYLTGSLDFETKMQYILVIRAIDSGPNAKPAFAQVTIHIEDSNDNAPVIDIDTLSSGNIARVSESAPLGTHVAYVTAIDDDDGDNGRVACSIDSSKFSLDGSMNGRYNLITSSSLAAEGGDQYSLLVSCHDLGVNRKTTTASLVVEVIESNDHSPVFNKSIYTTSMTENNMLNEVVLTVAASDFDRGSNGVVRYSLHPDAMNLFHISHTTGVIKANYVFDRELIELLSFHVLATDQGAPRHTATALVNVRISDVDDNGPIFNDSHVIFSVSENLPPGRTVGAVTASDKDAHPYNTITYVIRNMRTEQEHIDYGFDISSVNGEIVTTQSFDRESHSVYYLTIEARGTSNRNAPSTATVGVTMYITDENDNSPRIVWPRPGNNTVCILYSLPPESFIGQIIATDADIGDNGRIEYSIKEVSPSDFSQVFAIDTMTGKVTTKAPLKRTSRVISVKIAATDNGMEKRMTTQDLLIRINSSLPGDPDYDNDDDDDDETEILTDTNLVIIISLASSSIILIFLFCVAMFLIKRTGRSEKRPVSREVNKLCSLSCWEKQCSVAKIPPNTSASPILPKPQATSKNGCTQDAPGLSFISNKSSSNEVLRDSHIDGPRGERPSTYGGEAVLPTREPEDIDFDIVHLKQSVRNNTSVTAGANSSLKCSPQYTSVNVV